MSSHKKGVGGFGEACSLSEMAGESQHKMRMKRHGVEHASPVLVTLSWKVGEKGAY